MKLRWHLAALVVASVVPLVIFASVVMARLQREERARFEQELVHVTRAISVTFDRELLGVIKALQSLAGSALLDGEHLATFQRRAEVLTAVHEGWHDVVLIDPHALTTVMGLGRRLGDDRGAADAAGTVREVVAQRRPMISDSFISRDSGRLVVALLVPVERAGRITYVLGAHYEPAALMRLVGDHDIPQLWAVGIVDRAHVTIARSRGAEFVGKPANPAFVTLGPASGVVPIQLPTLEGVPAHGAVARSSLTGWLIGVSRSGHPIEASLQRSGWTLASAGVAFLLLGFVLAAVLASRITRPMVALSESGATLEDGGLERLTRSGVTEVSRLARAIVDAEREHDALLRREAQVETEMLRKELAHVGRVSVMGQLSASLAHEVNQPLCAIALNAEAVRRTLDSPRASHRFDIRSALDDIVAHARGASAIIGRMRALFRNETAERRAVDVNAMIGDVASLVHGEVAHHGIAVTCALEASLPPVPGDVVQLQQVVLNLLVNACEALGAAEAGHRALTITTARREDGHVEITVRDTGPGVTEHNTERLFAPFVTSKPNGLGMGLAICRSIVESHGGRIWATRNDDRGLTVHVVLPVEGVGAPASSRPVPVADALPI